MTGGVAVARDERLGWPAFLDLLARFAGTAPGQDAARALAPRAELAAVAAALLATREARAARRAHGAPPWDGLADLRPALHDAAPEGAVLTGPVLAACGRSLAVAARLAAYGARLREAAPSLAARWGTLPDCGALGESLTKALEPDGRLHDDASPRLRALRRQVTQLRADLAARLERLLDRKDIAACLQERYVTVRHGRYVLPIRAEAQRGVRGIVHDHSQSGATVFVEPAEVVDLNNQLTQRLLEERDEEQRLLALLTAAVRAQAPALHALVAGLAALDVVFAQAALAERLDATEPEVGAGGDLELRAARHPLLVAQRWAPAGAVAGAAAGPAVVPVDVRVPAARPGLVISGPNAGGKTVALETAGLLTLMAQAGCHLPVAPGSRLPVADRVLAVIGDEQSLAQDLSTFSSFVLQAREILAGAGPGSLVLLDELGAGTDPAEGAALGAALIEALLDRGARVIVTTHLEPLKVFAQLDPRLVNATVAFDPVRLEPTFRLEYGHPGPSYALTIGERLGLPPAVIARAREHLTEERQRVDTLLAALAAREQEAQARLADAARREQAAAALAAQAREALAGAEGEAARVRHAARDEARTLLADARRQAGQALDRLRAEAVTRREAQEAYHRLRAAEAALAQAAPAPAAGADPATPAAGAPSGEVQLRGLGLRGRVVAEDAEMVTVQAGRLTVRVARREIEPAPAAGARPPAPGAVSLPAAREVARELHLRGLTTDEARAAVEKFLDDTALAGHGAVRLIHGKGTGALKRAVDACLKGHPLVQAFRVAPPAEGGTGVTVVELAGA